MVYQEYLQGSHWQEVKDRALNFYGRKCAECGVTEGQLDVHHLTYERLGCEHIEDLIVLCRKCHKNYHGLTEEDEFENESLILNVRGYRVPSHKAGVMSSKLPFPKDMSDNEIGKMARLAKLMIADSNMLGYRARTGIKAYTQEQIIEIIGLSHKRGREFIDKMIKLRVMEKTIRIMGDLEQEEYYINPAYFFAGKRISLNLYLLFRESLDPVIPAWVKREFMESAKEQVIPKKQSIK